MTPSSRRVLIIGGNSSIARHLLAILPDSRAIARIAKHPGTQSVGDYGRLRSSHFEDIQIVISCVGIVAGTRSELRAVNVELQASLAEFARGAGVSRYVAISSFSIFGACERIDADTPTSADDDYGRSKLDCENALKRLETDRFSVLSVAFPAIIGTTRAGKVEQMLRLWRRIGLWPVPAKDVARSMIGARAAAHILACAAADDRTGRVMAADPVPFGYRRIARWMRNDVGGAFGMVPIPRAGLSLLRKISPAAYRSMMTDSLLAPACNYAIECGIASSLREELALALMRNGDRP